MPFTLFPLTGGEDMQTRMAALGELKIAYEERYNLVQMMLNAGSSFDVRGTDFNAGDSIQSFGLDQRSIGGTFYQFGPCAAQLWIEGGGFFAPHWSLFVDSSTGIEGNGTESLSAGYASLAAFRAAAGLNAAGFTRKYWKVMTSPAFFPIGSWVYADGTSPTNGDRFLNNNDGLVYDWTAGAPVLVGACYGNIFPDTVTTYGLMQPGDFLLHIDVLNEIYRCFRLMTKFTFFPGGDSNTTSDGAEFANPSFAAVKGAAAGAYNLNLGNGFGGGIHWGARGSVNWNGSPADYGAEASGIRQRLTTSIPTVTIFSARLDFYIYGKDLQAPSGSGAVFWDANGQDVLQNQWHKITTVAGFNSLAPAYSDFIGFDNTIGVPSWPPDPNVGGTANQYIQGFDVTNQMAILDYGVAGGFDKY